jgi:hypothetical protein
MTIQERVQEVFNKLQRQPHRERRAARRFGRGGLENGTVIYTDGEDFAEGEEAYIINDEGERIPLPPGDYDLADGGRISIGEVGKVSKVDKPGGGDAKNVEKGTPNIDVTKPVKKKPAPDAGKGDAGGGKGDSGGGKPGKKKKLTSEEDQPKDMKVEFNREEVLAVLTDRFPDLGEELAQAIASAVADVYAPEVVEEEANEEEKEEMNVEETTAETTEETTEELEVEIEVEMSEETKEKSEVDALKEALELTNARIEEMQKLAAHSGLKHKAPTPKPTKVELSKMSIEERVRALSSQFNS